MHEDTLFLISKSWCETKQGAHTTEEILRWIAALNGTIQVEIQKISMDECDGWRYDPSDGTIHNENRTFFSIVGFRQIDGIQQPIILQNEIGFLGIICREIDGVMHFLMQAKIEPGNVNKIQISPTIQATKSNFTQKHGGAKPPYLEYFENASKYEIVVDQIQSEQSSRFLKKRNRNIIIRVEENIPVLSSHFWMTLGQIKRLMREDNLVNMDTRTVLSCIPYAKLQLPPMELLKLADYFTDKALFRSVFIGSRQNMLPQVYQHINNCKMFAGPAAELVPLHTLDCWQMGEREIVCRTPYPFKVVFCDIEIEGREVRHWTQPLFEAVGIATFGLLCCEEEGVLKFVVKAVAEAGCFDGVELGPTLQKEAVPLSDDEEDTVSRFFEAHIQSGEGVVFDHLLSEEGGRFYHEQNRNILLRIKREELPELPKGYFLLDYKTLNELVQINNTLNIQLRNLLSLLEA